MRYSVTFLLAGEEQTARIEATTAAAAAATANATHGTSAEHYELLRVHLLDTMPAVRLNHAVLSEIS